MKGRVQDKLGDAGLCAGFFLVNLLCFYRQDLFFYLDDFLVIWSWARDGSFLRYLLRPHNEHFVPLAKLFYVLEVACFREHYGPYILTNCALMAITAVLWKKFLQRLGLPAWLAIAIPLVACASLPSQENLMLAWQSGLILSAASLIGAIWAYLDSRLYACFLLAAIAALTFSSAIPICLALAGFLLWDGYGANDRRLRTGGYAMLALFGFLVLSQRIITSIVHVGDSFQKTFWSQPTVFANLAHLAWLAYYTVSLALTGPFLQMYWLLTGQGTTENLSVLTAVLGTGGAIVLLILVWRSSVRLLVIQLLLLQIALFVFIGPFRQTGGLASRYYTSGSIPLFSAVAVAAYAIASRTRLRAEWIAAPLLAILAVSLIRLTAHNETRIPVRLSRAARLDYFSTKSWLLRHKGEVLPNHVGVLWDDPWITTQEMITLIPALDRSFSYPPTVFRKVHYQENPIGTRPWAFTSAGNRIIEQTLRFDRPEVLTKLELWSCTNKAPTSNIEIVLMDGEHPLWSILIPPALWPSGTWLAAPVDMIHLLPGATYLLRVRLQSPHPGDELNLMMNGDPSSYPRGETRTPDGSAGDLCFRLALLD